MVSESHGAGLERDYHARRRQEEEFYGSDA
jgi:hypothetical protein